MFKRIILSVMIIFILGQGTSFAADELESKSIVIYYSINNSATEMIAKKIQSKTNADIYKIETAKQYPDNCIKFSDKILNEITYKKSPKLKQKKFEDLYKYDTVYLGTPVYYGDIAPAMRAFLKSNKLNGKTVAPFYSLDNGGVGASWKNMKKLSGKTHFKEGFEYSSKVKPSFDYDLDKWLNMVLQ